MQIIICIMVGTTSLANASPNFESIAAAWSGANEVLAVIDAGSSIDNFSDEGEKPSSVNGEVTFEHVAFAYPSRPDRRILTDFNLGVKRGETVALVGPSGCGKSTTVQMLLRYYDAVAGSVSIDGIDVKKLSVRWLRQSIGLVGQEPVLFNTTIRDNIALGAIDDPESVTNEEIIKACRLSNAHDFISALPEGYNTMVGERGAQLSGGQKQRIAIARALVKDPKILVLDEATSALDTTSEKVVQEALDQASQGRTTLVIAHRLSTIRNANKIAVINQGVVQELGDHSTLVEQDGLYAQLVKNQQAEEAEKRAKEGKPETAVVETVDETKEASADDSKPQDIGDIAVENKDAFEMLEKGKTTDDKEKQVSVKEKMPGKREMLFLVLGWGKPELKYTILCFITSILVAGVQPGFAIVVSEFLGNFCPEDTDDTFKMLVGIIMALGATQAILLTVQHYLFSKIGENLTARMRCRLLGKFLRMDAKWLDRRENQPSALTTILATDCADIQGLSGIRPCIVVTALVIVLSSLIYSLILDYRVALAIMALMPIMIITTVLYNKMIVGDEEANKAEGASNAMTAMDALSNMRTVMALGAEQYFLDRFNQQFEQEKTMAIKKGVVSGPLLSFPMSAILFMGAITFTVGSHLMEKEETTFIEVMRIYILITFSGMAIGRSSSAVPDSDKAVKAAYKISKILAERPRIDKEDEKTGESVAANQLKKGTFKAPVSKGRIEFKNVSFAYPTRPGVQVLKNVSFTVEPGQRVALCGTSGGGKSTIMQLVQRIYDADSGQVLIDGVDIKKLNIRNHRANIGLVAQEPVLFALSIKDNISYGSKVENDTPSDGEIDSACRQANAHEFLSRLPEGLETPVGERGAQMSGGQKQRIAIARYYILTF